MHTKAGQLCDTCVCRCYTCWPSFITLLTLGLLVAISAFDAPRAAVAAASASATATVMSATFPGLRLDLSRHGEALIGVIAPLLTASNSALYGDAAEVAQALAGRCSDSAAHVSMTASLLAAMAAKVRSSLGMLLCAQATPTLHR